MALINCPKCGKEISEKAKECPSCGTKIVKCSECGKYFEAYNTICPECGCPVKRKNKLVYIVPTCVVAIAIGGVIIGQVNKQIKNNAVIDGYKNYVNAADYTEAYNLFVANSGNSGVVSGIESYSKQYAKSLLENKEYKSLSEMFNKKIFDSNSEFKNEIVENVIGEVDKEIDLYSNDSITYNEVSNAIKDIESFDNEKIDSKVADVKEKLKKIKNEKDEIEQSAKCFEAGNKAFSSEDYETAYSNYKNVIESDANYKEAQEKLEESKQKVIESYEKKAKEYADDGKYSYAIIEIEDLLKLIPDDKDIIALRDDYKVKETKERERKEKEEKKKNLIKVGDKFSTKNYDIEVKELKLTRSVYPEDTSGYYSYYSPQNESEIYFDMKFKVKNTTKSDRNLNSIIDSLTLTYDGQYEYDGFTKYYSNSNKIETMYSSLYYTIEPLTSTIFHAAIVVPEKLENSDGSIEVEFKIDGEKKYVKYR